MPGDGRAPLTLPIMMIDPPAGWACITSLAAWATCKGAIRFSSMTRAWKRGDAVAAGARGEPPALLITTSTPPNKSRPAAISRRACSGSLTSARVNAAVARPAALAAAGSAAGSFRPQTSTRAPERRNPRARPAPMPRVPPVTITRQPEKPGNGWSTGCMAPC